VSRSLLLTFSDATSEEQVQAFNEWYDRTHVPEILAEVPGIVGATRYEVAGPDGGPGGRRFLAIYEIEADDPQAVLATLGARAAEGAIAMSPTLRLDPPPLSLLCLPVGDGPR
jgi:hypothetical protein